MTTAVFAVSLEHPSPPIRMTEKILSHVVCVCVCVRVSFQRRDVSVLCCTHTVTITYTWTPWPPHVRHDALQFVLVSASFAAPFLA